MPSPGPNLLLAMVAEFSRACTAAQRYEDLRHGAGRIAPADAARRVFDEFYAFEKTPEVAPHRGASAPFAARSMRGRKGVVPG
jgi:hypothetical protein